ncbi:MAG: DNA (cytosine-5-)-methyltransferase [Thermofilum sp. ex4484_15]|nr:MAG: DNA (cytosine-5-)-methyltransferase [Thermofilum sp. ex4484_15]
MKYRFKVVDLFCGAGGLSRGFKEVGFDIMLGLDNYPPAIKSFKENFPGAKVIEADIKEIRGEDILSEVGEPDVVVGGPPCEAFTRTNPDRMRDPLDRLYVDPRGSLVLHFIRIIGELNPSVFIMENVPGILEGGLREALIKEFLRIGYREIHFNVLKAEDYLTPSHRTRVFISNIRIKPRPQGRRIKVIEAIGDLPEPDSIHDIPNHEPVPLSRRKKRKISRLRWGQALIHFKGAKGKTYVNLYRLHPYRLAPTIMGSSRFIHPFSDRIITVREQARLMGFPDDHIFKGGRDSQFEQVGEAVPVPLAKAIAMEVAKYLLEAPG